MLPNEVEQLINFVDQQSYAPGTADQLFCGKQMSPVVLPTDLAGHQVMCSLLPEICLQRSQSHVSGSMKIQNSPVWSQPQDHTGAYLILYCSPRTRTAYHLIGGLRFGTAPKQV